MEILLPPGIPPLKFEELETELVSFMHGEETSISYDVIEYYIKNNKQVQNAYEELRSLVQLLGHTPAVEPSKKFVRRVARALPKLKDETRISSRIQNIILHAGWGFQEKVIFLLAYIKYRLKHQTLSLIALLGCIAFIITTATLLPRIFSTTTKVRFVDLSEKKAEEINKEILEVAPLEREIVKIPAEPQHIEPRTYDSWLKEDFRDDSVVPEKVENNFERPPKKDDPSTIEWTFPKNYPTYSQLIGTGFNIREKEQILPWFSKRKFSDTVRDISEAERKAIFKGLEWLSKQQFSDGSFRTKGKPDKTENKEFTSSSNEGLNKDVTNADLILTSFTALTFITEGYASFSSIPSKLKRQTKREYEEMLVMFRKYQRITRNAINFIKNQQREDGFLSDKDSEFAITAHSIALLALIEDRNTCNNWRVRAAIVKGVETLKRYRNYDVRSSYYDGGWGDKPDDNYSKLTPTFWALLALKSAANSGIEEISLNDVLFTQVNVFLRKLRFTGGLIGESVVSAFPEGYLRPTAEGLALEALLSVKRLYTPENIEVLKRLTDDNGLPRWELNKSAPGGSFIDYEYWFYGSLAVAQSSSDEAQELTNLKKNWRSRLVEILTQRQMQDGRWLSVHPRTHWGDVYSTALAVLSLQNQYRYNFK